MPFPHVVILPRFGGAFIFGVCQLSDIVPEVPKAWGAERRGWHIDKTISVSDLISIIVLAVPMLVWASNVESRFALAMEKISNMERLRAEDRQSTETKLNDLQSQLRAMDARVNDRLDKIADKIGAK